MSPWPAGTSSTQGDDPVPVGRALDRLVRHLGWAERSESVGALQRWAEVVGPAIAAHSKPIALDDGTLTIAVDDATWASQLTWLETDLLRQLQAAGVGPLQRIVVRVRPESFTRLSSPSSAANKQENRHRGQ